MSDYDLIFANNRWIDIPNCVAIQKLCVIQKHYKIPNVNITDWNGKLQNANAICRRKKKIMPTKLSAPTMTHSHLVKCSKGTATPKSLCFFFFFFFFIIFILFIYCSI